MKSKNLTKLVVVLAVVATLILALPLASGCATTTEPTTPTTPTTPEVFTFRVQTTHAPVETRLLTKPTFDDMEAMSGGRLKFEVFSGGELLPGDQIIPALQAGTLDFAVGNAPGWSAPIDLYPVSGHAVGRWASAAEMYTVFEREGFKELLFADYEELGGIKMIANRNCDPIHLVSNKPVETYEDLKGMKIIADKSVSRPFTDAGASCVSLPVEEYYLAGQTGVVDGLIWSGSTEVYANGWYEVFPYFLTNPLTGAASHKMAASLKSWESLPSDLQKIIEVAFVAAGIRSLTYYYQGEGQTRQYFTLTTFSDEDWAKMQASIQDGYDELAQVSSRAAEAVEILKEYDARVEAAEWFR
ncbi:TRAP transporter substrate-binding protein DctP [Chloroflexota bacterium]